MSNAARTIAHEWSSFSLPLPVASPARDGVMTVRGVSFERYAQLRDELDRTSHVYLTFDDGTLEIMSPSNLHEGGKTVLGRLVETYATLVGLMVEGGGSTTFKSALKQKGLEPDECYALDRVLRDGDLPDFAIEVDVTHGSVNKLKVYAALGFPEVWLFRKRTLTIHSLQPSGAYLVAARSRFLPNLDPALLAACAARPSQTEAIAALRAAIAESAT